MNKIEQELQGLITKVQEAGNDNVITGWVHDNELFLGLFDPNGNITGIPLSFNSRQVHIMNGNDPILHRELEPACVYLSSTRPTDDHSGSHKRASSGLYSLIP